MQRILCHMSKFQLGQFMLKEYFRVFNPFHLLTFLVSPCLHAGTVYHCHCNFFCMCRFQPLTLILIVDFYYFLVLCRFILGFFLGAIPWYVGAIIMLCCRVDYREKPGYIACIVAVSGFYPFLLYNLQHRYIIVCSITLNFMLYSRQSPSYLSTLQKEETHEQRKCEQ